ncbi:MAG: 4Fe-4S dicluster domain-containing protein [Chloroflexi bacterium]|nr:4Fe-4S dicluster domain-containing protein [Chloroflexota bacterium]
MTSDLYQRLAKHLDSLPGGYPATESGVELRILRRLFTPEEAALALHLALIPEDARVIGHRAGLSSGEAATMLQAMERKGLLYSDHSNPDAPKYYAMQFAVGIFEFQVGKIDAELAKDLAEYLPVALNTDDWQKVPQLRTVPIGASIDPGLAVMPYERAIDLMSSQTTFGVAPCVCRQKAEIAGHACDKPSETCLTAGSSAEFYIRNGLAREISKEEALALLEQAEATGLILQPGNARNAEFMCMCCGCCCAALTTIKQRPDPASIVSTPFRASVDWDRCDGCGTCLERCQMDAISFDTGVAEIIEQRCIGCGLCVSTCPQEAVHLERKPAAEQSYVPHSFMETLFWLGRARGKLGVGDIVKIGVRSAVDRLVAPR